MYLDKIKAMTINFGTIMSHVLALMNKKNIKYFQNLYYIYNKILVFAFIVLK